MSVLSLQILFPLLSSMVLLFIPSQKDQWIWRAGMGIAVLAFLLSLTLWIQFDPLVPSVFQWVEKTTWIESLGISYHVGIDGLGLILVTLTTFLTPVSLIVSRGMIQHRIKEFVFSILFLETALLGTFCALDMFLFYVFWEATLLPMALLIGVWGGAKRIYATKKFFVYTFLGSILMLVAMMVVFWFYANQNVLPSTTITELAFVRIPVDLQLPLLLMFLLAFAIKIPMVPVHTWLPLAHVEAPMAGSILLAGVLLKMGAYGVIRFAMPLFPYALEQVAPILMVLSVIGILYGAMMAYRQTDIKRLVAYSSVSHMGFVTLGIFSLNEMALSGAMFQLVAHGLSTGTLFLMIGLLYQQRHTREMSAYGGIASVVPRYTTFFMIAVFASIGLPGLCGFVGEFLILMGSYQSLMSPSPMWITAGAALGILLGAMYMLKMTERLFLGPNHHEKNHYLKDLNLKHTFVVGLLCVCMLYLGVRPNVLLDLLKVRKPTVTYTIGSMKVGAP